MCESCTHRLDSQPTFSFEQLPFSCLAAVSSFLPISSVLSLSRVSKQLHRVFSSRDFDVSYWQYAYKRATKKANILRPYLSITPRDEESPVEMGLCILNGPNGPISYKGSNHRIRFNGVSKPNGHNGHNGHNRPSSHKGSNHRSRPNRYNELNGPIISTSPNNPTNPNSPNSPNGAFQSELGVMYNTRCFRWRLKYLQDIELPRCVEDAFPLLLHPLVSQ